MIKIKDPIKTKLRTEATVFGEAFFDRIVSNYNMMSAVIAGEDLLHMVTAPPEVYLAEGGGLSVVNNTSQSLKREENIEIINNLVNRIIVSADTSLTYQDRVFISTVLNKLGIRDEKRFMQEVNRFYDSRRSVENLISLYEEHGDEITSLIREYRAGAQQGPGRGDTYITRESSDTTNLYERNYLTENNRYYETFLSSEELINPEVYSLEPTQEIREYISQTLNELREGDTSTHILQDNRRDESNINVQEDRRTYEDNRITRGELLYLRELSEELPENVREYITTLFNEVRRGDTYNQRIEDITRRDETTRVVNDNRRYEETLEGDETLLTHRVYNEGDTLVQGGEGPSGREGEGPYGGEMGAPPRIDLHSQILNRLHTMEFGDIINRFNQNNVNRKTVTSSEFTSVEQGDFSRALYLNALQQYTRQEAVPLYYREDNYYEETALDITREGDTNIERSLTASVLLELIKKSYSVREGDIHSRSFDNYDFRSSLYRSVDTLLTDFRGRVENFLEGNTYQRTEVRQDNRAYIREAGLIENIVELIPAVMDHPEGPEENGPQAELVNERVREIVTSSPEIRQYIDDTTSNYLTREVTERTPAYLPLEHPEIPEDAPREDVERITRQNIINQNRYIQNLQQLIDGGQMPGGRDDRRRPESPDRILELPDMPEAELTLLREDESPGYEEPLDRSIIERTIRDESRQVVERVRDYLESSANAPAVDTVRPVAPGETPFPADADETAPVELILNREGDSYDQSVTYGDNIETPGHTTDTETLRRELEEINRRNITTRDNYIREIQRVADSIPIPGRSDESPMERNQRLAMEALSDQEGVELSFRQEGEAILERERIIREAAENALPRETRLIFEKVRELLEGRDQNPAATGGSGNLGMLMADIHAANAGRELTELIYDESRDILRENIREVHSLISYRDNKAEAADRGNIYKDTVQSVDMFHREQQSVISEELLEAIREERRATTQNTVRNEEQRQNTSETHTTVINNQVRNVQETNQNIEELVRNQVRTQLNTITDKVYSRLERRLGNERVRRGY